MITSTDDFQKGGWGAISAVPALIAAVALAVGLATGATFAPLAAAQEAPALRAAADARGLLLGTALGSAGMDDAAYLDLIAEQSNAVTFENEAKFGVVHPEPDRYDFAAADRIAAFARDHDLAVRGHVLLWHVQDPAWLEGRGRDELLAIMRDHIHTVVGHFRDAFPGLVVQWDVVNEPIDNDGSRRQTVWQRGIGDDWVAHAFRFAREADPDVELYINEYLDLGMTAGAEYAGREFDDGDAVPLAAPGAAGPLPCDVVVKCRALRALVEELVDDGVPIDGVGFQGHIPNPLPPDYRALTSWVGGLGLDWAITEFDVPVPRGSGGTSGASADHQVRAYRAAASACLDDPACDTFVTWGLSDRHSWWNGLNGGVLSEPLHFDATLAPKPSAHALADVLAGP